MPHDRSRARPARIVGGKRLRANGMDLDLAANAEALRKRARYKPDFSVYSKSYEMARELERQSRPSEALTVYQAILTAFAPEGTAYFERPAILLERLDELDEAIQVCDRAIEQIEDHAFHADAEPFRKRKARLLAKKRRRESLSGEREERC